MINKIHEQKFYSLKTCLKVVLSNDGTFFEIAGKSPDTKKNGMYVFEWDKTLSVKFNISELCLLSFALKVFFGFDEYRVKVEDSEYLEAMSGPGAFVQMIPAFFPNSEFNIKNKTFYFTHKQPGKKAVTTGLAYYKGKLYFSINSYMNMSFPVTQLEVLRLIEFIDWIIGKRLEMRCFHAQNKKDEKKDFSSEVLEAQNKLKKEKVESVKK